jgi:nucleotide-binding universal stress UspA family protein
MVTKLRRPTVVVGVDGSSGSLAALRWAARQARATGADVRAVTAWQHPRSYGYEVAVTDDWRPDIEADRIANTAIESAAQQLAGVSVETKAVEGHPAVILTGQSEDAELLVVGSRGHGLLTGVLLGSVSEYCASHSACPVVIVRPHHH